MLTMTFLALDTRDELPRVSYATALDLYVAMCFIFVLSTLVQFAIVHLFTKRGHNDTYPQVKMATLDDDEKAPVCISCRDVGNQSLKCKSQMFTISNRYSNDEK